jgi:hypothetical protein
MRQGLLYTISSHNHGAYLREAARSANSFRTFLPETPILLFTDATEFDDPAFDHVEHQEFVVPSQLGNRQHMNGVLLARQEAMLRTPFDRTLVMGADTLAVSPDVRALFELMERFDIAAAHAPFRVNVGSGEGVVPDVPVSFPEFNCEIIVFRRSEKVLAMLEKWREMYRCDTFAHPHDQGTFRYLMYMEDLRIATLPPEYNYRGNDLRSDTVIIHNRAMVNRYLAGERPSAATGMSFWRKVVGNVRRVVR